jgi:hypothetical protein
VKKSLEGKPAGRECGVALIPVVCETIADFIIEKVDRFQLLNVAWEGEIQA